ncbi:PhoH family protein [Macrococcus armenti]|uniref:PhoH family protein n=1 Tax=Macrococcus armenti TaxID=2875764 RepID=UPI001CCD5F2D|nr:PhoH family protein [Macrococcus armenti]UBH21905.1 PhoH family protein [Macrococcus armenti]
MTKLHGSVLLYGLRERMTDEQEAMVESILTNRLTIVNAKAGTGKTTIAVAMAKYLYETNGQRCVFLFGTPQERTLGYRPGTTAEKELEYLAPLIDALQECGEQDPLNIIQQAGDFVGSDKKWIEARSHTFTRGTNLKGKTVIVEEAQNLTRGELKKVLTRISDDCTVIMIGHDGQCDLPKQSSSGFIPYLEHFRNEDYCEVITLTKSFRGDLAEHADKLTWD